MARYDIMADVDELDQSFGGLDDALGHITDAVLNRILRQEREASKREARARARREDNGSH